ncbi:transmembrane adipocyte-associated 1 -like protein, partial [Brachionus plicatilis]
FKVSWLIIRFSQLGTELSVVFFGIFFARLESHKSIFRIMSLTIPISLLYISIQACLEFVFPDKHYVIKDQTSHFYDLFGLGGMIFWFVSSTVFTIIYFVIYVLPFTNLKEKFPLPMNRSFYLYCLSLGIICFFQSVGSLLVYLNIGDNVDGLCILNLTTFIYFTLYGPLVYFVFLRKFFRKEFLLTSQYLINSSSFNSSTSTKQYNSFQGNESGNWDASWNSNEPRTSRRYSINRDYFFDRSQIY